MYSSNSFNVCPHCGKANSLNARYCSSCGRQLAVPEEVVVCHKCGKPNTPMATFCGACGAPLRVGAQTKICPRCHKEVDASENMCVCGYRFSGVGVAEPEAKAAKPAKVGKMPKEKEKTTSEPAEKTQSQPKTKTVHKGGRLVALFGLIFLLVFAYAIIVPVTIGEGGTTLRPEAITSIDKGLFSVNGNPVYAYDLVMDLVGAFTGGAGFEGFMQSVGIGGVIMTVIVALCVLSIVLQLLGYIIRIITGTRNKKGSLLLFILALLTLVWAALVYVSTMEGEFFAKMGDIFLPKADGATAPYETGLVVFAVPAYFLFFWLFSALTKAKKIKENVA